MKFKAGLYIASWVLINAPGAVLVVAALALKQAWKQIKEQSSRHGTMPNPELVHYAGLYALLIVASTASLWWLVWRRFH